MAFKPDHGLLEGMGGWKNKEISVVILEIKHKEVVFGNCCFKSCYTELGPQIMNNK